MPKIAFVIFDFGPNKIKAINEIRKIHQCSLNEITQAVNEFMPVFQREMFDRHNSAFTTSLVEFLDKMEELLVNYKAYELSSSEEYDNAKKENYWEITSKKLKTLIEAREKSMKRQERWAEFED